MTRGEAKAAGEKRYQGRPCKNCGRTEKFVSSYNCVACSYERTRKWHRENYVGNPNWRKCRNSEERRQYQMDWKLWDRYRITREELQALLLHQDNRCQICQRVFEGDTPHVDHCHDSGEVRGLLCGDCNRGLGLFRDDPEALERAAEYIKENHG